MKKAIKLKVSFIVCAIAACLYTTIDNQKVDYNSLTSENIEALARGEIDIPGVCANISRDFCIVFSDGYFLTGVRVA